MSGLDHHSVAPLIRYPPSNNSLLSSGNAKKAVAYEPRTEAISPAINDDMIAAEDSTTKSTKDEQTLLVEKLKKVEAEILQTDLQIVRLRKQKAQLEQAASCASRDDDDSENVCDTKQLSIAKLVYHENRAKAQKAHAKLEAFAGPTRDLPIYNQPSDNAIYHFNAAKFTNSFKKLLISCFKRRLQSRLKLEGSVSAEYDRRMEKWLKSIEQEDSQPAQRVRDAKTREFFEKQFPELKKARESGERFSRVGQRVARSDAELDELLDGLAEREDQDKKVKSYAVIPPMLEEMRSTKPKFINTNGYVEDIIAEYKEYQILNTWTKEEKEIFKENFLQHPKNFGLIATMTGRKSVANCVQYYYMSKKSENYKQLLKRQQKRRTRSFVKPAQQTPSVTSATPASNNNESTQNNDSTKANGSDINDKQGGDSIMTDIADQNSTDQAEKPKSSALNDSNDNMELNGSKIETKPESGSQVDSTSCCICGSEFSCVIQYRNVTRSNHQLYGIALGSLKPGMRICYPCRFRHVKHPSFDDPAPSPDQYEVEEEEEESEEEEVAVEEEPENKKELLEADTMKISEPMTNHNPPPLTTTLPTISSRFGQNIASPVIMTNNATTNLIPQQMIDNSDTSTKPSNIPNRVKIPPRDNVNSQLRQQQSSSNSVNENSKGPQRTCVRDIIYQAIEMSFQESQKTEPFDTQVPKLGPHVQAQECRPINANVSQAQTPAPQPQQQQQQPHAIPVVLHYQPPAPSFCDGPVDLSLPKKFK